MDRDNSVVLVGVERCGWVEEGIREINGDKNKLIFSYLIKIK